MTNDERTVELGKKILHLISDEAERERVPSEVAIGAMVVATATTFKLVNVADIPRAAETFRADIINCATMSGWCVPGQNTGIEMIAAERARQIAVEGWTPVHDDFHQESEISLAAECYVSTANVQSLKSIKVLPPCFIHKLWPWTRNWWKPSNDPVRNLVKAGALIAAEIDRIQRQRVRDEKSKPAEG